MKFNNIITIEGFFKKIKKGTRDSTKTNLSIICQDGTYRLGSNCPIKHDDVPEVEQEQDRRRKIYGAIPKVFTETNKSKQ